MEKHQLIKQKKSVYDSVVYVDSPFQLLQVLELDKNDFKISKVFIRLNGKEENDKQLKNMEKMLNIESCKFININNFYQKIYYYTSLTVVFMLYKNIIFGDANCLLFRLIHAFKSQKNILLLDDGVATINDKKFNDIYQRFTIFPKYVSNPIVNNFYEVQRLSKECVTTKKHVIVGGKFVDEGICDEHTYNEVIKKITSNLNEMDTKCIYIPHRGETDSHLARLKKNFTFQIIRLDYPIELLTLESGIYPLSISHVMSTAVFSMRKIYSDVDIFTSRIPASKILLRRESIGNIYKEIEREAFTTFL